MPILKKPSGTLIYMSIHHHLEKQKATKYILILESMKLALYLLSNL